MSRESTELEQNEAAEQGSLQGWSGRTGTVHTQFTGNTVRGWTPLSTSLLRQGSGSESDWCQGKETGSVPSDGLRHMSCRRGRSGSPQKGKGTDLCSMRCSMGAGFVSPVSCYWWGWAEDDGNEVERGGKHKRKFILEQSDAPVAAASFRKVRSYSSGSHARPGVWRAFWMISNLYLVRSDHRWRWEAPITTQITEFW